VHGGDEFWKMEAARTSATNKPLCKNGRNGDVMIALITLTLSPIDRLRYVI
jgi:hypothetical protein